MACTWAACWLRSPPGCRPAWRRCSSDCSRSSPSCSPRSGSASASCRGSGSVSRWGSRECGSWFATKVALTGDGKALAAILLALVGISVGTLYQKRYCSHVDLRSGAFIQFTACAIAYAPIVFAFEPTPVRWTPEFAFALGWAVIVLSVGAISLLYWLLRHGAASNVAGLFFLVPAVTAVMAWLLFGETLDSLAIAGMALISVGVALARQMRDPVTP
jgi:drug/metabolite transporter (DMT)-like permease